MALRVRSSLPRHGGEWFFPATGPAQSRDRCSWVSFHYPGDPQKSKVRTSSVLGYWVGARRLFHLSVFLSASRMVLPKILVLTAAQSLGGNQPERVALYFHGGAFCLCTPKSHRALLMRIVENTGATVLAPDYRRPVLSFSVQGSPYVTLIELRLALISYQDYPMLSPNLAGRQSSHGLRPWTTAWMSIAGCCRTEA